MLLDSWLSSEIISEKREFETDSKYKKIGIGLAKTQPTTETSKIKNHIQSLRTSSGTVFFFVNMPKVVSFSRSIIL